MNALMPEDLTWAAWASHDAARAEQRTLDLLGNCASPNYRTWAQDQIAQHQAREIRFRDAWQEAFLKSRP